MPKSSVSTNAANGRVGEDAYSAMIVGALTAVAVAVSTIVTHLIFWLFGHPVDRASLTASLVVPIVLTVPLGVFIVRRIRRLMALQEEQAQMASLDSLTALLNRRAFFDAANALLKLAKRNKSALSLVMLDLDFFKRINDSYGHVAGDDVLRQFALKLTSATRDSDLVCRYGGEEFLVLLPGSNVAQAFAFSEKLRDQLSKEPFVSQGSTLRITLSAGVTGLDVAEPAASIEGWLAQADQALYVAKRLGRNRTRIYPQGSDAAPVASDPSEASLEETPDHTRCAQRNSGLQQLH